jgi:putative hydrolase of the HAD superfamily
MPPPPSRPRVRVDALLLDIDDTLVDTRAAFFAAIHTVSASWLDHLPAERHDEVARRWIADVGGHFRSFTRGEISITDQRRRRAADLQGTFGGADLDDEQFAAWETAYDTAFRSSWRLHDDALALLEALDRIGIPVGALSNSTRELSVAKLERLGLTDRLPLLVSPDDLGFGKPDPRVFHLACERLGSVRARTAYVGDELDVDAHGAQAAGLVGIWLERLRPPAPTTTGPRLEGVLVAHSLVDLLELVDLGAPSVRR